MDSAGDVRSYERRNKKMKLEVHSLSGDSGYGGYDMYYMICIID